MVAQLFWISNLKSATFYILSGWLKCQNCIGKKYFSWYLLLQNCVLLLYIINKVFTLNFSYWFGSPIAQKYKPSLIGYRPPSTSWRHDTWKTVSELVPELFYNLFHLMYHWLSGSIKASPLTSWHSIGLFCWMASVRRNISQVCPREHAAIQEKASDNLSRCP